MRVAGAILASTFVALLLLVQPILGRLRYGQLVQMLRIDPRARARFYRRGIASEWILVAVIGVIGLLEDRGPSSIRLTWHTPRSSESIIGMFYAAVFIAAVAASAVLIRRSRPKRIDGVRKQVRRFVELIPRTSDERWTFVAVAVTAGICEEVVYRGFGIAYVKWLFPSADSLAVILIIGAAFGAVHAYQGLRNMLVTGLIGGLLAWLTIVTGTLLPAMAVHVALDLRVAVLPAAITEPEVPDRTHCV